MSQIEILKSKTHNIRAYLEYHHFQHYSPLPQIQLPPLNTQTTTYTAAQNTAAAAAEADATASHSFSFAGETWL